MSVFGAAGGVIAVCLSEEDGLCVSLRAQNANLRSQHLTLVAMKWPCV